MLEKNIKKVLAKNLKVCYNMGRKDDLLYAKSLLQSYVRQSSVPEFKKIFEEQIKKIDKELEELDEKSACTNDPNSRVCNNSRTKISKETRSKKDPDES